MHVSSVSAVGCRVLSGLVYLPTLTMYSVTVGLAHRCQKWSQHNNKLCLVTCGLLLVPTGWVTLIWYNIVINDRAVTEFCLHVCALNYKLTVYWVVNVIIYKLSSNLFYLLEHSSCSNTIRTDVNRKCLAPVAL